MGVMCGGEKQGKRVWSNAIQRLVSKTVHYNIHDIHDAVNRENMQVYAIWLLYYIIYSTIYDYMLLCISLKRKQFWDDKECANDVDVLDELIMGIIETRGDESAAISKRSIKKNNFYFLDSTIASGVMKVAGNASLATVRHC